MKIDDNVVRPVTQRSFSPTLIGEFCDHVDRLGANWPTRVGVSVPGKDQV